MRDIERKLSEKTEISGYFKEALEKALKIHTQKKADTDTIYSWHVPEVECMSKGKAHKPYDGHTLEQVLQEMETQTGVAFKRAYVDRGYRGYKHPNKHRIFMSGQKRGITATIKRELRRRSVVEPLNRAFKK